MSLFLLFVAGTTGLFLTGYLFALIAVAVLELVARALCATVDAVCAIARRASTLRRPDRATVELPSAHVATR